MTSEFPQSERSRLRRRPQRGAYDEASVFAILDASLIAHLGYAIDGQPYVTPQIYWRDGRRLYWHGAAASRALRAQSAGLPVCVTVSLLDGLVLARSGFAHSANFRSAMAFGHTAAVEGRGAKRRAMDALIDRLYPGRTRELRPVEDKELDMIGVVSMEIEEASAKVRSGGVIEKTDADLVAPGWAGVIPVRSVLGVPRSEACIAPGVPMPESLRGYAEGTPLDEALAKAAAAR